MQKNNQSCNNQQNMISSRDFAISISAPFPATGFPS